MLLVNVVVFLVGAVAILALQLLLDVLKDRNVHRQAQMMAILMLVFPYDVKTRMMHMQDERWEFMSNRGDRLVFRKDSKLLVLTKVMLLYDLDNDCHCVFGFCHDKELFSIKFGLLGNKAVDSQ